MNFDQWIDAVNAQVRTRLGEAAHTEELSWDSAVWVTAGGTVVASIGEDERTATVAFDGGEKLRVQLASAEAQPAQVADAIAERVRARTA